MAEAEEKGSFLKDYWLQIVTAISILVISAFITYGSTQLQKIDMIEKTIKELPSVETERLNSIISDLQDQTGKSEAQIRLIIMSLKYKKVLDDSDISIITGK